MEVFRFRQFSVVHSKSSMKVGIDGVLVGAWGAVSGDMGLDIGCGCGLIALQAAQRNSHSIITAIDIHGPSIEEAEENFLSSKWKNRLKAKLSDMDSFAAETTNQNQYDFILSNPPFFNSGISNPRTAREHARHQHSLSPAKLLEAAIKLLKENGAVSFIMPADIYPDLKSQDNLFLERLVWVADNPRKKPKRVLVQYRKGETICLPPETLYIRDVEGNYHPDYINLTKPFYLGLINRR